MRRPVLRAARALVTARSRTIGILSTSAAALYGPVSSINAIQDAGRAAGYFIAVAQLSDLRPESIAAGLDHLLAQSVEGLIVIAPQEVVLQQLETARLDVPYVTLLGGPASFMLDRPLFPASSLALAQCVWLTVASLVAIALFRHASRNLQLNGG